MTAGSIELGNKIKELREARGFSQGFIAKKAGCERTYISDIEGGKKVKNPSAKILIGIAKALRIDYDDLFLAAGYIDKLRKEATIRNVRLREQMSKIVMFRTRDQEFVADILDPVLDHIERGQRQTLMVLEAAARFDKQLQGEPLPEEEEAALRRIIEEVQRASAQ